MQSLTERDLAILRMVYEYEGCVIDHIRHRFFNTPGGRTPCYRRVSFLVKHGYLTGNRLSSLSGQGSGKMLLTIGPSARPILAEMLGLSRTDLARSRMDSPMFIAHHLSICDVRLAFELAAERSSVFTLQEWLGDRELHKAPVRVSDPKTDRTLPIIPDSAFTLALPGGAEQAFFLEMDMGTVAPKRMRAKLRAYLVREGDMTPILFVATNQSRQKSISAWGCSEAEDLGKDPTIFWITARDEISDRSVLADPIWELVGGPKGVSVESFAGEPLQIYQADDSKGGNSYHHHGGIAP